MKGSVLPFVGASIVMAAVAVACSGMNAAQPTTSDADGGSAIVGPTSSDPLPCDVNELLAKRCRACHSDPPSYGAPIPLVTHSHLTAASAFDSSKKVFERVATRIHDDARPMPQPPNPRLDASELAVLDRWIAAGAPKGEGTCSDTKPGDVGVTKLACTPDQILRPATKFAMDQSQDLYVCYGFDTEAAAKRHVIAGGPHIDNTKIVHHILLYQSPESVSPTPTPCGAGGGANWRLVTGWAPGGKNFELPPEAGFAEEAGTTHWALQIHYNNALGLVGEVDESGYDLCSSDQLRPNDADILATGTLQINLPPRSNVKTTCKMTIPATFGGITVVSSWAHMHRLGRAEYAKRIRAGESTTLLDSPNYDFNTGATANDVRVDLVGGDTIETMCNWQNGGDTSVRFGEGTADEMCFAFLTYYPKITSPGFSWIVPSTPLLSQCTSTTQ